MSVIVSRALPDVRDGLKPVQRRILYGMYDQGMRPDRPHAKCAKVVGEVMGTYHPHGDSAIYDALARMAQDFSHAPPARRRPRQLRGTGPDDGAAAMRYTECRLAPLALELLDEIDEETVDFGRTTTTRPNSPTVLPARFPNLLVNGSQGIAVGMATNIPPHNLGEVIDATLHLLANPDATPDDLMALRQRSGLPDRRADPRAARGSSTPTGRGRGSIRMRAVAEIEETAQRHPHRRHRVPLRGLRRVDRGEDLRPREERRRRRHPGGAERLGRPQGAPRHQAEARRQRQRRAEQALQAHAAADDLRGQHARARRRRAAHAEPGPGPRRTTSRTRSTSSRDAASSGCARPRPEPTSSRDCSRPSTCSTSSSRRSADPTTARPRASRLMAAPVRLLRGAGEPHPRHDPGTPHPPRSQRTGRGDGQAARDDRRTPVDPGERREAARRDRRRR